MSISANSELIARRGELLAEMFLNDCGAKITDLPSFEYGIDHLAFFETGAKSFQVVAVQVKTIESPIPAEIRVDADLVHRAAQSNIPTLLLVVDVKQNKFGYAWLEEFATSNAAPRRGTKVRIPLLDAEEHREQIRQHVAGIAVATT
ncbi:MAG: DUF4365 domain-containing protein [Planctomycetales bacterium]